MSKLARAGLLILSICLSAPLARAQVQQSSSDSASVIRATTRLVQLDVVVTDSSGHPPKDHLGEKDFTILEDGKLLRLSVFLRIISARKTSPSWKTESRKSFRSSPFSSSKDRKSDRGPCHRSFHRMWPPTGRSTAALWGRRSSCCSMVSTHLWRTRLLFVSKCSSLWRTISIPTYVSPFSFSATNSRFCRTSRPTRRY